jgi:hypothetical protein
MSHARLFQMPFAKIYPFYVQKAERKGRTSAEVDAVIRWLTGYDARGLRRQLTREVDLTTFFAEAPRPNPAAAQVTGTICGHRIDTIEDPLLRRIRVLDKLVDELAKGRPLEKVLRA